MKKHLLLLTAILISFAGFSQRDEFRNLKSPNFIGEGVYQAKTGDAIINVEIQPDNYASDISWELIKTSDNSQVGSGSGYVDGNTNLISESFTVSSDDCFTFIIYDAYGDGICCTQGNGYYTITYDDEEVATGGDYGNGESVYGIGGGCPDNEIVLLETLVADITVVSESLQVKGKIQNTGISDLTSYQVTYNVNGGEDVGVYTVENISKSTGETHEFTHDVPFVPAEHGSVSINVTVSNPNGEVDNVGDNTATASVCVGTQSVQRNVLLENFTTAQCPNCPPAHTNLEGWLEGNNNVIWLAHHAGYYTDPMTIDANTELLVFYNASSTYAPAIMLDRKQLPSTGEPGPVFFPAATSTPQLIQSRVDAPSIIEIGLTGTFNPNSKEINVDVASTFYGDFSDLDVRLGFYIMEDGIMAQQSGVTGNYEHNHTMRRAVSATMGDDVLGQPNVDEVVTHNYTSTLESSWDIDELTMIAFVAKYHSSDVNKREILQAQKMKVSELTLVGIDENIVNFSVYPNPAQRFVNVVDAENATLKVYNNIGQMILVESNISDNQRIDLSSFEAGSYIVKVELNGASQVKHLILTK